MRKTNVSLARAVISSAGSFLTRTYTNTLTQDYDYTPVSRVLMMPVRHRQTVRAAETILPCEYICAFLVQIQLEEQTDRSEIVKH